MIYINPYLSLPINTIIGGVGGSISTKAALATKLGIWESTIRRFEIVGSDVHAHITSNYSLPNSCFQSDLSITKYIDMGNKCTALGISAFENAINLNSLKLNGVNSRVQNSALRACPLGDLFEMYSVTSANQYAFEGTKIKEYNLGNFNYTNGYNFYNNTEVEFITLINLEVCPVEFTGLSKLKELNLPNLHSVQSTSISSFNGLLSAELISMRKLKNLLNYTSNGFFANLKMNCVIEVNIFLATANGGAPAQQLVRAKNTRAAIVKFYDDAGNYVSTL